MARWLLVAALVIALAGIGVAVSRDGRSSCDTLLERLASIDRRYGTGAPQRWEDVLALQDTQTQVYRDAHARQQILQELAAKRCP